VTALRLVISSGHNRPNVSGLYLFDGAAVRLIDALPVAGLSTREGRFYRVAALRQNDGAEVLGYDAHGVCLYRRIDVVGDPHDILAVGKGRLLLVSSRDNAIVSIDADGTVLPYWRVHAPIDAWHLNCLALRDGRLFATAFGRFDAFRGWHPTLGAKSGILFDVESGVDVVTGLSQPHSPRWIDGAWLICDSGTRSALRVEANGDRYSVPLGGFTRGMAVVGDHVYVGVSAPRESGIAAAKGWISVLDRNRWREIDRISMPCSSMYDLIEVDETVLEGLEAGFRSGSASAGFAGELAMFEQIGALPQRVWAISEPLPPALCRVRLSADLPETIGLGEIVAVTCTIENAGDTFLSSAPPFPVEVCYRWFDGTGAAAGAGTWLHTRLPQILAPGGAVTLVVLIAPPPMSGRFTLRLTLLQEGVVWFDDADPMNAVVQEIEVGNAGVTSAPAGNGCTR